MPVTHTPGPWTVRSRIDSYAAAGEKLPHGTASYIIKAAKDRTIARITHAPGIADVQAADACLIAAAPELLAALVEVTDRLTVFSTSANLNTGLALEAARAAITRATLNAL